jgi:hypothetical protein
MKEYEFTLKFSLENPEADPETCVEKLGSAGCDDALIGIGKNGRIALDFVRESSSAYDAVSSALKDVKKAIPKAKLVEATPDFVGLTDVADLLGFTRQNMRKLMLSSGAEFPPPVHEGKPAIWHLAKILLWLKNRKMYQVEDTLIDIAKANMQFNISKEINDLDPVFHKKNKSLIN